MRNLRDVGLEIPKRRLTVFTGSSANGWMVQLYSRSGLLDPAKPIGGCSERERP